MDDDKQQKWVPYVPDHEKWYQHLKDLKDGYVTADHMGRYVVGSGNKYRKLKEMEAQQQQEKPIVNLVTPVAQAVAIAQSEVKRLQKKHSSYYEGTDAESGYNAAKKQRKKFPTENKQIIDWSKYKY